MSTYLVAVVVSDFYVTKAKRKDGETQVSVTPRHATPRRAVAQSRAPELTRLYQCLLLLELKVILR